MSHFVVSDGNDSASVENTFEIRGDSLVFQLDNIPGRTASNVLHVIFTKNVESK